MKERNGTGSKRGRERQSSREAIRFGRDVRVGGIHKQIQTTQQDTVQIKLGLAWLQDPPQICDLIIV
jgi:preprotein translocase subunit YajC